MNTTPDSLQHIIFAPYSQDYHVEDYVKENEFFTREVEQCFQAIVEDRKTSDPSDEKVVELEKPVDGYRGFLFLDDDGSPLVATHWEHRFNNMVNRYNAIYKEQLPNITPHVCRHTYCSNMAKAGMNPKTLQNLMGHSDISVTLNTYTHLGLEGCSRRDETTGEAGTGKTGTGQDEQGRKWG